MNKVYIEGLILANTVIAGLEKFRGPVDIVLCPPFIHIQTVFNMLKDYLHLHVGAQNCHQLTSGAFTGDVSAAMLKSVGATYVILGHSERRNHYNESPELIGEKVKSVLDNDLHPIFCCGEPLEIREKNIQKQYVFEQIEKSLFSLSGEEISKIIIAYEPIWAIGTGKVASPEQAQEMHADIRNLIENKYGKSISDIVRIVYGGSCNAENSLSLFRQKDIDGALVGSASLNPSDFLQIVNNRSIGHLEL
jgi:triosephosphate isomerase (TIM)